MSFSKTLSEIASQGVTAAEFDALDVTTGAAGATTFLRGDKQWQTAGSTDAGDLDTGTLPAARLPAGAVLQVQIASYGTTVGSAGSYVDALGDQYITITKIAGSNIYLHWSTQVGKSASNVYTAGSKILRATNTAFNANLTALPASPGGSPISSTTRPNGSLGYNSSAQYNYVGNWSHTTIDTSITASAATYYYKWQFAGGSTTYCQIDSGIGIMVAMEFKA